MEILLIFNTLFWENRLHILVIRYGLIALSKLDIERLVLKRREVKVMFGIIKETQIVVNRSAYQYFLLLIQIACLSGAFVVLFETFWSASIFLPLSVGVEIGVKFLITHAIEYFVRHR